MTDTYHFLTTGLIIGLTAAMVSVMALSGCSDKQASSPASETPAADVAAPEVATPAPSTPSEPATPTLATVFEGVVPEAEMTGDAIYLGGRTGPGGVPTAAIADQDPNGYGFFQTKRTKLEPGRYRMRVLLKPGTTDGQQTLLRIAANKAANFERKDVFVNPDGSLGRTNGDPAATDSRAAGEGYHDITVDFDVAPGQEGGYRLRAYPAMGADNKLRSDMVGDIEIGGISLSKFD